MDIKDIKSFLLENKDKDEVKQLYSEFTPSVDELLEKEDFQKVMKSFADKEARRQVEAYKSNTLPKTVEEEVAKRLEASKHKSPEQIKFEEYEKKLADMQNQLQQKERAEMIQKNKNFAIKTLSEKKLPSDIIDFIVSDEEEKTVENINMFSSMMEKYTTSIKSEFMRGNNTFVPGKDTSGGGGITVPGDNASQAEWENYYRLKNKKT